MTAANIDPTWRDFPAVERLTKVLGRRVEIVNDADAAGIAEMRFGVGKDRPGVVIFLTLGTGVGSGTFVDGKLVPNTPSSARWRSAAGPPNVGPRRPRGSGAGSRGRRGPWTSTSTCTPSTT